PRVPPDPGIVAHGERVHVVRIARYESGSGSTEEGRHGRITGLIGHRVPTTPPGPREPSVPPEARVVAHDEDIERLALPRHGRGARLLRTTGPRVARLRGNRPPRPPTRVRRCRPCPTRRANRSPWP